MACFGGGQAFSREHHFHRNGTGQATWQAQDAAGIGDHADAGLRQEELDALGGDEQVASQRHLEAAADGKAVDGGDDGLLQIEKLGQPGEAPRAVIIGILAFRRILQIPAGGKEAAAGWRSIWRPAPMARRGRR